MDMEQKNEEVRRHIDYIAQEINNIYPGLMDEDKILKAKEMFKDSSADLETEIFPRISELARDAIADFSVFQSQLAEVMEGIETPTTNEVATLDLHTEKNGIYLSQQQIDLLMIADIKSKEELREYVENICGQFPNMLVGDIIPNYDNLTPEQLEEAKEKTLYSEYQASLIGYLNYAQMSSIEKAEVKLKRLGITDQELKKCKDMVSEGKISETFEYLGQKYGDDFIKKFNHYINDDFENVQAIPYDEMSSLLELIKHDDSIDTIIIATGKFDDSVSRALPSNSLYQISPSKSFDPYFTSKAAEFCYKNGKHMRYHALFDHSHVDTIISEHINLNGRTIDQLTPKEITSLKSHKTEILSEMQRYVKMSMHYIDALNQQYPGLIQEVEVFNELVEKNKKDKNSPYSMVWEKYFGISIDEIMSCFDGIKKPANVEFMYNETTLTESPEKRKMVEKVLFQIEQNQAGFIDRFGDQMHLSDEDVLTAAGRKNLTETAQMLQRIQAGRVLVNGQTKEIKPKKTECTEHDFHFTTPFLDKIAILKRSGKNIDLWSIKRKMQAIISNTYNQNGVRFAKSTYWTLLGKNDHNLVRGNIKIQSENAKRKEKGIAEKPLLQTMAAGLVPTGERINVASLNQTNRVQAQTPKISQNKSFAQRSATEVQIAKQINQKNQIIKQQKSQKNKSMQMSKPKVKTLSLPKKSSAPSGNKGFTNVLVLSLIIGLIAGALFMVIYMIVGR